MYIVKKYHISGLLAGLTTTETTSVKFQTGEMYSECLTRDKIKIVSVEEVKA